MRQEIYNVNEVLRGKRLLDMTGEELMQVIKEAVETKGKPASTQSLETNAEVPPLVTGIKDVARVLGISQSTVSRWKESGEIDDCVYQSGKTVIFDTHKILEKLRLSNRKGKYEKFKSNQQINQIWRKK
ncbi:DUF3853 family protein [Phocaeicola salanitronis]|mgnify:CR=1 FL=1|uniref:DUF3853 family protein n=1 Tax=Phocaeicola salanitronis TaxID=376805 RepID=UPI0023F667BA|nr:DUF3853 family protein [Phocaeicola salanitronis]